MLLTLFWSLQHCLPGAALPGAPDMVYGTRLSLCAAELALCIGVLSVYYRAGVQKFWPALTENLDKQQACLRRVCWNRAGSRSTGTCPHAAAQLLQPRGRGACLGCGSACRPPLALTWAITGPSRRSEPGCHQRALWQ